MADRTLTDPVPAAESPVPGPPTSYYRDLVELAPDAVLVVGQRGIIELVNRQAEALFGYTRQELLGQPIEVLLPERVRTLHAGHRASFSAHPQARPMGAGLELAARRKDGIEIPVDVSLSPVRTGDGMVVSAAVRDVSDRKRAEVALREAYQKLASSVRDLERHDREMTLVNEMGELLLSCVTGAEANEVIGQYGALLFPSTTGVVYRAVHSAGVFEAVASWGPRTAPDGDEPVIERDGCWALRRTRVHSVEARGDGPVCPHIGSHAYGSVCVPMMAHGEAIGLFHLRLGEPEPGTLITFQSRRALALTVAEHLASALANLALRETLRHQSISDPLTGLYNRRYLRDQLAREVHRATRSASSVGVIVADVDHLKRINDEFGHIGGDEVLREVARILDSGVRGRDMVCRVGGDEFVLVLPGAPLSVAQERAEQLRETVREGARRGVTLSLGVAVFPDDGDSSDAVLAAADAAMYRAKALGRDAVSVAGTGE